MTADTKQGFPDLAPGDLMWITHTKTTGIVTSAQDTHRSYLVSGSQGTGGRKRHHLVPMPADNSSNTQEHAAGPDLQDTPKDTDSGLRGFHNLLQPGLADLS